MNELFKKMFEGSGLSETKINDFYLSFASVIVLTILGVSKEKLNDSEIKQIQEMIKEKKLDEVFTLINSKYSENDWENMLVQNVTPIFKSYIEEVILSVKK